MFARDRFIDVDVMVNTVYAENQRVLGDLLEQVGDSAAAADFRARASRPLVLPNAWDAFADRVGLHRTYIGDVERGERNLGLLNIARIAAALEIAPSALLAATEASQRHRR
jgi:transcriptional regulator with XRE-family HTH domain